MHVKRSAAVRASAFSLVKMFPLAAALLASQLWMSAVVHALEVKPVESFDVTRYLGTWHEIASIPQLFQRKCVRDTKASYSTAADSLIRVDNVCTRDNGTRERASGRARARDPSIASKLEVTFLELFGEYRFWVAADYWVIALDPNYNWAVVGHPSRRYGWILSREPLLPTVAVAEIVGRLKSQGYDACEFLVTPQTGGLSLRRPLCNTLP